MYEVANGHKIRQYACTFFHKERALCLLLISECVLVKTFIKVQIYVHPDQFRSCFA